MRRTEGKLLKGGQREIVFNSAIIGLADALKRNERKFEELKKKVKEILKELDRAKLKGDDKAAADEIAKGLKNPTMGGLQRLAERLKTLGEAMAGYTTGVAGKKRAVGIYSGYTSWWTILVWAKGEHITARLAKVTAAATAKPKQNPGSPPDVMKMTPNGQTVQLPDANDATAKVKPGADAAKAAKSVEKVNKKLVRCDAPTEADAKELAKVFETPTPNY